MSIEPAPSTLMAALPLVGVAPIWWILQIIVLILFFIGTIIGVFGSVFKWLGRRMICRKNKSTKIRAEFLKLGAVLPASNKTMVRHCPECNAELPESAPQGLCPRCLLQCAMNPSAVDAPVPSKNGASQPSPGIDAPAPGELAKHFPQLEILSLLGKGGMGAVYMARQLKLDRLVALKILTPESGKQAAFAERFAREARALARLNHPHIVAVHDFGEVDGLYFFIMEYVDGVNLRQLLQLGELHPEDALKLVPQICEALHYAHEESIVHRDIKPENILIDKRGRVKIADFGLAKLVGSSRADLNLTGTHQVMGTLDYMAPEQRSKPLDVDHRADIYSLGVVIYEMLTGELPLGRFAPPSHKAPIDNRLDEVVFRALEREPGRRYQRVSEIKADVDAITSKGADAPRAVSPRNQGRRLRADLDAVRLQVKGPAGALMVVAVSAFLSYLGIGLIAFMALLTESQPAPAFLFLLLGIGIAGVAAAASACVLFGAFKMSQLDGYEFAVMGSFMAMLPWSIVFPFGFVVGIYALRVLRRPEVRAAFAGQAMPRPRPNPIPPAVGGIMPSRVHSFLNSMRGMFFTTVAGDSIQQSNYDESPRPEDPAESQYHWEPSEFVSYEMPVASRPAPLAQIKRKGKAKLALLLGVSLLLVGLIFSFVFAVRSTPPRSAYVAMPATVSQATMVLEPQFISRSLRFSNRMEAQKQVAMNKLVAELRQNYLDLEKKHTQRQWDDSKHLVVTITPFAKELDECLNQFWTKFDALATEDLQAEARSFFQLYGNHFFPFARTQSRIEIWQVGTWFHWIDVSRPILGGTNARNITASGARLPKEYERFWEDAKPKPNTTTTTKSAEKSTAAEPPVKPAPAR